jgi:hypothetical protein
MATKKATKKKVTIQRSSEEWQRYAAAALGALVVDADSDWTDEQDRRWKDLCAEINRRFTQARPFTGPYR